MNSITFTCEVVTPMFLAGADGQRPELRAPSIKGAMRFWWRAMHGYMGVDELRHEETLLFGGGGDTARRSRVIIKTSHPSLDETYNRFPDAPYTVIVKGRERAINLLEYLAYGTYVYDKKQTKNLFIRPYINVGQEFEINLLLFHDEWKKSLLYCLLLMSVFGGIGARARNGYGRVALAGINDVMGEARVSDVIREFKTGYRSEYTSFSKDLRLFGLKKQTETWHEALYELAKAYKAGRESLDNPHHGENRQYIASPLMIDGVNKSFLERHAKQYFFGVEKQAHKYNGFLLFMPYQFVQNSGIFSLPADALSNYNKVTTVMNAVLESELVSLV